MVDVPDAEAAPTEAYDRSRFKVRDPVSFVTAGRSYDLVVLSDTMEDNVGAMLWSGVRPVVLYERMGNERHIILHSDSIVLAGDQGGIFGTPMAVLSSVRTPGAFSITADRPDGGRSRLSSPVRATAIGRS